MAGHAAAVAAWGRDSDRYERYTSTVATRLADDDALQTAKREWERLFVDSHGDVFGDVDVERPRERLFVDSVYYDFVVDSLIRSLERRFDFRLVNPEPGDNTDALAVDFRSLHEQIVGSDAIDDAADAFLDAVGPGNLGPAFLRTLYEQVISAELRRHLGEYYTPRGVAELAIDELDPDAAETVLDPGCGSGAFLSVCVERKRRALADEAPAAAVDAITDTVFGIDLNPVAVRGAKLSYLGALLPLLGEGDVDKIELPVFLTDALGLTRDDTLSLGGRPIDLTVDHLVGNPPWLTWGALSESVRDAWRETYVERLGLLQQSGVEARLGHANDDVSVPFVWACIHRYLAPDGDAAFVLKRGLTKGPAGRLFRAGRVGDRPVAVRHVHDFTDLRPFGGDVDVGAAVYTLNTGTDTSFPVPVTAWTSRGGSPDYATVDALRAATDREATEFVPVSDDPASSWVRADAEDRALGECSHRIRHGLKDDAKEVFSVDRERLDDLEPDHVYPYLRSKHIVKYGLFGHDLHLVPLSSANEDNTAELRRETPATYDYLEANRAALEARSSSWLESGTFYNLFGLGTYTWSPYKVVWCRLGYKPHFAVVSTVEDDDIGEKPVVPGDHCMFIPTDDEYEAHFLCALLNSTPYQRCLDGLTDGGKSGLSKTVVSQLSLPTYEASDSSRRLAELSMAAHEIVPEHIDVSKREYNRTTIEALDAVQADIDALVEDSLTND
jgi:SAM-dependent methyltransferase